MPNIIKISAVFFLGFILAAGLVVYGATTTDESQRSLGTYDDYKHYTLINADTANATSSGLPIWAAERIEVYFTRNAGSASEATSTFEIEVSPDGTNWYDYNKLVSNVTNSNSQELTRVETTTIIGATSTTVVALDLQHDTFEELRCVAIVGNDGNNTCEVSVKQ